MAKTTKKDEVQPIIVKKIKKSGGGHHGGAWKVAYADFVTAMMAFFLLLWLLNVSTDEALETISNYFDPTQPQIADTRSGAGGLMGGTSVSPEGAMTTNVQPLAQPKPTGLAGQSESDTTKMDEGQLQQLEEQLRKQEEEQFAQAKAALEQAIQDNPELAELAKNLMIDVTEEGLRIQLVDQDGKPMFPSGSAEMYGYTRKLMKAVADVALSMPNNISLRGHTDSYKYAPGATYTNWELSADRANASRRVLLDQNIPKDRIANVMGKADREHLIAENPLDARNRRISIILLRESLEQAFQRGAFGEPSGDTDTSPSGNTTSGSGKPVGTFQRTPGAVYFP